MEGREAGGCQWCAPQRTHEHSSTGATTPRLCGPRTHCGGRAWRTRRSSGRAGWRARAGAAPSCCWRRRACCRRTRSLPQQPPTSRERERPPRASFDFRCSGWRRANRSCKKPRCVACETRARVVFWVSGGPLATRVWPICRSAARGTGVGQPVLLQGLRHAQCPAHLSRTTMRAAGPPLAAAPGYASSFRFSCAVACRPCQQNRPYCPHSLRQRMRYPWRMRGARCRATAQPSVARLRRTTSLSLRASWRRSRATCSASETWCPVR